jgi:hypothetical protein
MRGRTHSILFKLKQVIDKKTKGKVQSIPTDLHIPASTHQGQDYESLL